MNRVAGRSFIAMILVLALLGGMVFFLAEYVDKARDWVMFSGSPHVYANGKLSQGMVLDRKGALLLDLSGEQTYATDPLIRKAMLHWTGDRAGNIARTIVSHHYRQLVSYDPVNGLYTYGDNTGRMTLTLSYEIQTAALKALGDRRGTVAVYNYKTGEILCAVSTPTFDPEDVPDIAGDTTGAYQGAYYNRFTQSTYTPGSIFKIVTLGAVLESDPDAKDLTFSCDSEYEIGKGKVTCGSAHGKQTLKQAFLNSCNCAFAQLVEKIGREDLQHYVSQFGVMESVSFDGITTTAGNFDISNAYYENLAWSGIGQYTDLVNPCSFLRFVGAVAAGGAGVDPYVVSRVQTGDTVTYQAQPRRSERIMSQLTADTIREYMRNNVKNKYGDEYFAGFTACAKTGTAEVGSTQKPNAVFTGFLLEDEFPLAFIVVVEDAGYGQTVCVPIISQVLEACKQELS